MDRCPTCGARHRGEPQCHRCQTDLSHVLLIEELAARLRQLARTALERGCATEAGACADRADALHRCPDSLAVRALIALHARDFPLALRLWQASQSGRAGLRPLAGGR